MTRKKKSRRDRDVRRVSATLISTAAMPALEMPFGPRGWTAERLGDQAGKTFVITGCTSGCGFEVSKEAPMRGVCVHALAWHARMRMHACMCMRMRACALTGLCTTYTPCPLQAARLLLSKGARVIMLNRDPVKSADVVAKLQKEAGGGEGPSRLSFVLMDLGDLASVRKAASELLEGPLKGPGNTIAALMCNAAIAQVAKQKLTVDGLESQLGVNYMGHFLLCGLLFERLAACEARIVVVGSNGYKMGSKKINFDDLNWDHTYDPMAAYNQSKLAQTMFAFELQRRIQAAGKRHPAVFMCHPGASSTQLCKEEAGWFTSFLVRALMASPLFQSAEKGSWPEVMCATEASLCGTEPKMYGPTGSLDWKGPVGVCPLEEHALDREAAAALWTISEAKTGFKWHQI